MERRGQVRRTGADRGRRGGEGHDLEPAGDRRLGEEVRGQEGVAGARSRAEHGGSVAGRPEGGQLTAALHGERRAQRMTRPVVDLHPQLDHRGQLPRGADRDDPEGEGRAGGEDGAEGHQRRHQAGHHHPGGPAPPHGRATVAPEARPDRRGRHQGRRQQGHQIAAEGAGAEEEHHRGTQHGPRLELRVGGHEGEPQGRVDHQGGHRVGRQ